MKILQNKLLVLAFSVLAFALPGKVFAACNATINFDVSPKEVKEETEVQVSGYYSVTGGASECEAGGSRWVQVKVVDNTNGNPYSSEQVRTYVLGQRIPFNGTVNMTGYSRGSVVSLVAKVYMNRVDGPVLLTASTPVPVKVKIQACLVDDVWRCNPTGDVCGGNSKTYIDDSQLCGHGNPILACVNSSGNFECYFEGQKPKCVADSRPRTITRDLCNKPASEVAAIAQAANGSTTGKFIPACVNITNGAAFLQSECGDITIFLKLGINIINYLFGIIGGIALLFFVYGGVVFILSQGNADKVQQGKSIILAAVLGIIVAFSGYALVSFVGNVIGIKSEYQLNK